MSTLLLDQGIEIPTIRTLSDFRRWIRSEAFPPRGRIDYVNGRVEVDTSPEDVFTHGTLKSKVAVAIERRVVSMRQFRARLERWPRPFSGTASPRS